MAADLSDLSSAGPTSSALDRDQSVKSTGPRMIEPLRERAEAERQEQLQEVLRHREELLKEFFLLRKEDNENDDQVIQFLKSDLEQDLDPEKLKAFLEQSNTWLRQHESKLAENKSAPVQEQPTEEKTTAAEASKKAQKRVLPPPERMVTRGVSGAIRHKSVGEILSGLDPDATPSSPRKEKRPSQSSASGSSRRPVQQQRMTMIPSRRPDSRYYPPQTYNGVKLHDVLSEKEPSMDLFAWYLRANAQPLHKEVRTARKVVTTRDWTLARDELRFVKALQNIEDLKKKNMWSLRQLKRHKAPQRSKTHWDILLDEMKWMRTDFKEEKKWKIAMAWVISRAVMEWHWAEDKSTVCVKTRIPSQTTENETATDETQVSESSVQRIFTRGPSPEEDDTDVQQPGEPAKEVELECMQPLPTPPQQQSAEPGQQEEELTEAVAASTLPPEVIQSYRASIRDLDPNIPIFTLRMEDMGDFDIHALFPDLLTYEPPNPSFNDPYFDELEYGRIVPISRLLSRRITFARPRQHSRKRKIDGQVVSIQDETDVNDVAPLLPRNERYDNTQLIPPLFAPKKTRDLPVQQPRAPSPPSVPQTTSSWSEEDDLCLISQILQYGFNWDLVCDAFNSIRSSLSGVQRTPWECYARWKQNNLTTLSGQVSSAHLSKLKKDASRRQSKLDTAKRRQRQYNVFEAIKRSQKKREESQRMSVSAPMPRSTIETHGMSSSGQRLPTAMELSLAKAQRDRHVAQMLMDHRHFSMQGLPHQGHSAAAPQARPPTAPLVSNNQPSLLNGTPTASTTARPPPAQPSPSTQIPPAPVPGIPINRYPAAQLQLLRQQQQLALLAMAQAQSQGQAAPGPTGSPHMQRFPGAGFSSSPGSNSDLASLLQQQQQQLQTSRTSSPQLSASSSTTASTSSNVTGQSPNALAVAARLMQMGYHMPHLPPAQQLQLQRYLAHLQMRNQAMPTAAAPPAPDQQQQQNNVSIQQQPPPLVPSPLVDQQQQQQPTPQQLAAAAAAANVNAAGGANVPAAMLTAQQQQLQRFQHALQVQQLLQLQQMQLSQQAAQATARSTAAGGTGTANNASQASAANSPPFPHNQDNNHQQQ